MDKITVSQVRAKFAEDIRGRQPYVVFQIGGTRLQTQPMEDPGEVAAWPGSHSGTGFSFDASRELFAAVYDHAATADQTLIGMGAQTLDASTETNGFVRLMDARHTTGWLTFHLDTHGYDFGRPVYGVWGANIENPNDRVIDIGQFGGGGGTSS